MKTFKTFMAVAMVAVASMSVEPAFAQNYYKQQKQEQKEQARAMKQQQEDLYKKSPKMARKTAKAWAKDGWMSMNLPIEKQLERTWERECLYDEEGYPKYVSVTTEARGTNFSAAQMQAENVAKIRIASNIAASVASLADIALANNETTPELAASLSKALENTKIIVAQKIGKVFTGTSVYRKDAKGIEVRTIVLYDQRQAMKIAHQVILEELKNESDENRKQLESMLGMDKIQKQYNDMEFDEEL